jgi:hypothetical protein
MLLLATSSGVGVNVRLVGYGLSVSRYQRIYSRCHCRCHCHCSCHCHCRCCCQCHCGCCCRLCCCCGYRCHCRCRCSCHCHCHCGCPFCCRCHCCYNCCSCCLTKKGFTKDAIKAILLTLFGISLPNSGLISSKTEWFIPCHAVDFGQIDPKSMPLKEGLYHTADFDQMLSKRCLPSLEDFIMQWTLTKCGLIMCPLWEDFVML